MNTTGENSLEGVSKRGVGLGLTISNELAKRLNTSNESI